jgi:hypothetical protein
MGARYRDVPACNCRKPATDAIRLGESLSSPFGNARRRAVGIMQGDPTGKNLVIDFPAEVCTESGAKAGSDEQDSTQHQRVKIDGCRRDTNVA